MKKILIVGGTGFIGYHLIKYLKKKNFNLFSISTKKPQKKRRVKKVTYLIKDISKKNDIKSIKEKFDNIINLSGYVDHSNKKLTYNTHYIGCMNLVKYLKNTKIKSFIQVGSSLEYGKIRSPQREDKKTFKTHSIYSRSKLLATRYLMKEHKLKNYPVIILRGYQIYGPNQDNNRLISSVIFNCFKNKFFPCSSGEQLRDFLYIDDFIRAIYKALNNDKAIGNIINIGSGNPIKVKKVILLIQKMIKKGKPNFGKINLRKDELKILYPSISKAFKILKWKPRIKFENGLKKTILYYRKIIK